MKRLHYFEHIEKHAFFLFICLISAFFLRPLFPQNAADIDTDVDADAYFYPAHYLHKQGFSVEELGSIGKLKLLARKDGLETHLWMEFRDGIAFLVFQGHMYALSAMPVNGIGGLALSKKDGRLFQQLLRFYENKFQEKTQPEIPEEQKKSIKQQGAEDSINRELNPMNPSNLPRKNAPPNDKNVKDIAAYKDNKHRLHVLIIDPGHGGKDPGAVFFAYKEKDLVLEYAKQLRKLVRKQLPGIKVVLTRTKDEYISLAERCRRAHSKVKEAENALFLSIHLNAWPSPYVRGFELYYLQINEEVSEQRVHYHLENFDFLDTEEKAIQKIFSYFTTSQFQWESRFFADKLLSTVQKYNPDYAFNGRQSKSDNFYVLRGVIMPAILIELGFLSNEEDLKFLFNREKTNRLFSSMVEAIESYDKTLQETKNFSLKIF